MKKINSEKLAALITLAVALTVFGVLVFDVSLAAAICVGCVLAAVAGVAVLACKYRQQIKKCMSSQRSRWAVSCGVLAAVLTLGLVVTAYAEVTNTMTVTTPEKVSFQVTATPTGTTNGMGEIEMELQGNTLTIKLPGRSYKDGCDDKTATIDYTIKIENTTKFTDETVKGVKFKVVASNAATKEQTYDWMDGTTTSVDFVTATSGNGASAKTTLVLEFTLLDQASQDVTFTTTFQDGPNGTYTVDGAPRPDTANKKDAETYALVAAANEGYEFYCWMDDDGFVSDSAEFQYKVTGDSTVFPIFKKEGSAAYAVEGKTSRYVYLNDAISAAGSNGTIVVLQSGTVYHSDSTKNTFDIGSGVTLLVPYASGKNDIGTKTETNGLNSTLQYANVDFVTQDNEGDNGQIVTGVMEPNTAVTYTLTVPSEAIINVKNGGKFVVGGTLVAGTNSTTGICAATAGDHANIQLEGTLNVQDKGILSTCGYILGGGTVNAESGGTVYQPFVFMDHKDGHYAYAASAENNSKGYWLYNRHSLMNIRAKLVLNSGSDLHGYVAMFTKKSSLGTPAQFNVAVPHLIGSSGETVLFQLEDGSSMTMTYSASKTLDVSSGAKSTGYYSKLGRTNIEFNGNVALGNVAVTIQVIGSNFNLNSANSTFPLGHNYNVVQKNGTFSVNNHMSLLPGSTFTVEEGAAMTLASGKNLVVFDGLRDYGNRSESVTLDGDDQTGGTWPIYHYPSSADLLKYNFSSTAELIVNGTLNIKGNFGGTVQTNGTTGKIVVDANATPSATAQFGVQNKTVSILGMGIAGSCGKTVRTLDAQVFTSNNATLKLEAGNTYLASGNAANSMTSYSYSVYASHTGSATAESRTDLGATVVGTWVRCPHTETTVLPAVAPDCLNTGLSEGSKCARCEKILVAQTEVSKLPHADAEGDGDHICDTDGCSEVVSQCADLDMNHACNECGGNVGEHKDDNKDHACDYGCSVNIGEHKDTNSDHNCEYGCSEPIGEHADSEEDNDHVCDHGCGQTMEDHDPGTAADCTNPQTCTICGEELEAAKGHTVKSAFTWTVGEAYACNVTLTCEVCDNLNVEASCDIAEDTEPATCGKDGKTVYTASYTYETVQYTDTREKSITATGIHVYDKGEYGVCDCGAIQLYLTAIEVSFDSEILLRTFYMIPDALLNDNDAYVEVTKYGTYGTVITEIPMAQIREAGPTDYEDYMIEQGIAAPEMGRDVIFRFIDGKGRVLTIKDYVDDSVKNEVVRKAVDYATRVFEVGTQEQKELVQAMLVYGGYAQKFFKTDADQPVFNILEQYGYTMPGMDSITKDTIVQEMTITGNTGIGIGYTAQEAHFDSAVYHTVFFALGSGAAIEDYRFDLTWIDAYGVEHTDQITEIGYDSKYKEYYVEIEDIASPYLDYLYNITVTNLKTNETYSVKTSVLVWAKMVMQKSSDTDQINLAKAVYYYNQAANKFFKK